MKKRLAWTIGILAIFGLAMLSSAGIVDAQKKFGTPYYYFSHQLLYGLLPGALLAYFLSKIDYHFWRKTSLFIIVGALFLMTLVFVPQFGFTAKGAVRWLNIGGFIFQPAEILKLALVVYLAAWFGGRFASMRSGNDRMRNRAYGAAPFFILLGFVALLLALQPDIGTLIVIGVIAMGMYFLAGVSAKQIVIIGALAVLILGLLIRFEPYRFDRIQAFIDPDSDPRGISYQVNQAKIAIGAGGLFGVGFGHSTQKQGSFLPEVVGDSIFAIVAEELGFVGALAVIGFFVFLCFTLTQIANSSSDAFGKLFVSGINIWIMAQAFINIAAISGLAPLTGIPLPFISYGGTAIMMLLAGIGITLNIARK